MDQSFLEQHMYLSKEELCEIIFEQQKTVLSLIESLSSSPDKKIIKDWAIRFTNLEHKFTKLQNEKSYLQLLVKDLENAKQEQIEINHKLVLENNNLAKECKLQLSTIENKIRENKNLSTENERMSNLLSCKEDTPNVLDHYNVPSSKKIIKPTSTEDNRAKKGGAKTNHKGHGRANITNDNADYLMKFDKAECISCPADGHNLIVHSTSTRTVKTFVRAHVRTINYVTTNYECPICRREFKIMPNDVMAKRLYDNKAIAGMVMEVYGYNHSIGEIERRFNINHGTFINIAHDLAEILLPVYIFQEREILNSPIVQMDETGWREDGIASYCWNIITKDISHFKFINSRSSLIPLKIFGVLPYYRYTNDGQKEKLSKEEQEKYLLNNVTISDFYSGYNNKLPTSKQRCFEHLRRMLEALSISDEENNPINVFINEVRPWIVESMKIDKNLSIKEYIDKSKSIRCEIEKCMNKNYDNDIVFDFQRKYWRHEKEFYQWTCNPQIDSHNNKCESSIRPIAISRAISKGSQSEQGLITKSVLSSVILTLMKRGIDPFDFLVDVLSEKNKNPDFDVVNFYLNYCNLKIEDFPLVRPLNFFLTLPSPNGEYAGEYPASSSVKILDSYLSNNFDWETLDKKYDLIRENNTVKIIKKEPTKKQKDSEQIFYENLDEETISKLKVDIFDVKNNREIPYNPKEFYNKLVMRIKQNPTRPTRYSKKQQIQESHQGHFTLANVYNST